MIRSDRPLLKQCETMLLEELRNITIERMGSPISVHDIIVTILQDEKVDSVFCEGSFVMYAFNKICKRHSEHRLVKPGDIDLHIDYNGSWFDFIGAIDHRETRSKITELSDKRQAILRERRDMDFQKSQSHKVDEFKRITNDISRLTSQDVAGIDTPITQLLSLKSSDVNAQPFNIAPKQAVDSMAAAVSPQLQKRTMRELLELYNPQLQAKPADKGSQRTITVATSIEFPLLSKGTLNWKANPSLELTVSDIDAKKRYHDDMRPGYVVENIPKLYFALGPGGLRITGENLYDNYTDISLSASERGDTSCASLIKAYELYLRYMVVPSGKTYGEHVPIDPLRSALMFHNLECLKSISDDVDKWEEATNNEKELDEEDLNEFICGILKKIGNKHYSSQETTQRMLAQLRESLYHLMRGNFRYKAPDIENKFDPYLIDCMVQCLASGMYSKLNETDGSILQRMYELKVHGSSHLTTDAAGDIQASYEKYFQQLSEMPDRIRIDIATAFEMTNKGQLVDLDKKIRHKVKELHALTEQNVKDSARRSPSMAKGGKRTRRRHKPRKHTKRKHKGKKTTKRRKTSNRKHKKAKTRHR